MSQMTREDMLRELELLPVWQLREPVPTQPKPPVTAVEVAAQVLEKTTPAHEMAVIEMTAPEMPALEISGPETSALETAAVQSAPQQTPLRMLLSESSYAFLLEPSIEADAPAVATLLQNMLKAMKISCDKEIASVNADLLLEYAPKVIISMGAMPANALSGKQHTVEEWRALQAESQIDYKQRPVIVTYHPAHLLQNLADKAKAWQDLCRAKKILQNL